MPRLQKGGAYDLVAKVGRLRIRVQFARLYRVVPVRQRSSCGRALASMELQNRRNALNGRNRAFAEMRGPHFYFKILFLFSSTLQYVEMVDNFLSSL